MSDVTVIEKPAPRALRAGNLSRFVVRVMHSCGHKVEHTAWAADDENAKKIGEVFARVPCQTCREKIMRDVK